MLLGELWSAVWALLSLVVRLALLPIRLAVWLAATGELVLMLYLAAVVMPACLLL